MIKVTVIPKEDENIYSLLISKEKSLRDINRGTLHRKGKKKKGSETWEHSSYPGWIKFQKCLGGILVALVNYKEQDKEWQLLSSFIGFLDRHFREEISSITLSYEIEDYD